MSFFTSKSLRFVFHILLVLLTTVVAFGQTTTTYNTPGVPTWVCPSGVTSVTVQCTGGGGRGFTANATTAGGGGGAYASSTITVTPGTSYTITVGAGSSTTAAGGSSSFNALVVAVGGNSASNATTPGAGGLLGSCTGTVRYSGGNGAAPNGTTNSGSGGGGAGSTGNGGNAISNPNTAGGGAGADGGNGGLGRTTNGNGNPGNDYGGGGAGCKGNSAGGNGARGLVKLTYTCPSLTVSAGSNQNLAACATTTTLAGSAVPTGASGLWSVVSGTATITTPTSPTSGVTGLVLNSTATLRWTITNGDCGPTSGDVTITTVSGPGCHTYCTPTSTGTGYPITNVTFAGINNSVGNPTVVYENFSSSVGAATVVRGSTNAISVTATGASPNAFYGNVFFDWNNDGDFDDAGEEYQLGTYTTTSITYTGSVVVPTTAALGTTRMRVMHKFASYSTSCFTGGNNLQVEDYSVTITAGAACSGTPTAGSVNPASVSITPSSSTTLTLSGASASSGLTYQWQQASAVGGPYTNVTSGTGGTTNVYTTPALTQDTYYRVIVTCGAASATSAVGLVLVEAQYCAPGPLNCSAGFPFPSYHLITRVQFGTLNNTSPNNSCGTNGYTDYTGSVAAPSFLIGSSNNLTLTNVGPSTYSAGVWIDFNQNGSFLDPGEFFSIAQGTISGASATTVSIPIPPTALVGTTRMRIQFAEGTAVLSSWTCFTNATVGEMEDYSVTFTCPPTPADVTGKFPLNAAPMTCGVTTTLRWNGSTCATGFKVYLGTTNPPTTLVSTQTTTSYYTGSLAGNTTYYWKIVPYNGSGDGASSVWSFTTNTPIATAISQDESSCASNLTLTAGGGAFPDYYWYDVALAGQPVATGTTFSPTVTTPTTFYVENSTLGAETSIATAAAATLTCSGNLATDPRGWGNMFDIDAKTANLIITRVSVRFRSIGAGGTLRAKPVTVWIKDQSYATGFTSSAGWTLLGNYSVNVADNTSTPTIIDIADFEVPAGATYGVYVVFDNSIASGAATYANADIEVNAGAGVCSSEFGEVYHDLTFQGAVYYKTKCSSPRIAVVATPWISSAQIKLASASATGLVERCTESGWTYYAAVATPNDWLFAINKNGNTFTASVNITEGPSVYSNINTSGQHGSFLLSRYWNATITSGSINPAQPVSIRFFVDTAEIRAAINARNTAHTSYPTTTKSAWRWFKSVGTAFDPAVGINGSIFSFSNMTPTEVNNMNIGGAPYTGFINNVAYVQLGNITSFSGGTGGVGFSPWPTPLPVELLSFDAVPNGDKVKLNWITATEINNKEFTIERSGDGENFETVTSIEGAGNSNSLKSYGAFDSNPLPGISYYRLVQTDFDGLMTRSEIKAVEMATDRATAHISPNPVNTRMEITYTSPFEGDVLVAIYDVTGKLIYSQKSSAEKGTNKINFDVATYAQGLYTVTFIQGDQMVKKKFLKN